MTVFRVFQGGMDYAAEARGTAILGRDFSEAWKDYTTSALFAGLLFRVKTVHGCTVTYSPDNLNDYEIHMEDDDGPKFHYFNASGRKVRMKLKSEQDDPTDKKVNMCIPSRSVDETEPYLAEAVDYFKSRGPSDEEKQAFLLGLLLMKRCR
jgi:hypothetical protein